MRPWKIPPPFAMAELQRHPEFRVPVSELDVAGKDYDFPVRASWVRGALEGNEAAPAGDDGRLEVRLSKSGSDVVVHGRLRFELTAPCARCLEPSRIPVDEKLSLLMVPASRNKAPDVEEYEFTPEEADVVPFDGDNVILDDVVRDELVLQIPMIPLCSEDCPGMSAPGVSGADPTEDTKESVDPRLLPLLRFKNLKKE
ncbi:DUF177 domain-containing protein [Pendulispora brunnea]|uniref:DUF177 domain-containing protein n=1 Tax=Pendulispora brunnea TaxID=2905690 RepID=A0ABZ2KGG1_9BACT